MLNQQNGHPHGSSTKKVLPPRPRFSIERMSNVKQESHTNAVRESFSQAFLDQSTFIQNDHQISSSAKKDLNGAFYNSFFIVKPTVIQGTDDMIFQFCGKVSDPQITNQGGPTPTMTESQMTWLEGTGGSDGTTELAGIKIPKILVDSRLQAI